ncbi:GT-D fold domain-containing glycosyltransferase [Bacteroides zhangwenhongii]|uniref:GT-D fold domain-containing glycosyltransferase n=1 Tax=Bacteroides zhangwenhongii TaxID=2650157 RepID=UPI0032C034DB
MSCQYKKWQKPEVMSLEDTLQHIVDHRSSICRYGDGEFNIALGNDIGFQHITRDMAERMRQVLDSDDDNILIAIPSIFGDLSMYSDFSQSWWKEYRLCNLDNLRALLKSGRRYPNSLITRFTSDYKEDQANNLIPLYRKIWDGRDIYIVEGEKTRIGVGNDLLSNAKNLYRILAPAKNAYDKYDEIVAAIKEHVPWGSLVILALGPTATIMAYDLAKMGYQALDLGHFDIQYEYHIRDIHSKQPIPGKYVNEASTAGQTVDDSVIQDESYGKSIIERVI